MLGILKSRKQIYPIVYYGLLMPLVSGIAMGLLTGFSLFTGRSHFAVELMAVLYSMGMWIAGAYVFGGCTALITGFVVSIMVNQNLAKWKLLLIAIISAVLTSLLILFFVIDFRKTFTELMMVWSVLGTLITTLLYFRTKNFYYFNNIKQQWISKRRSDTRIRHFRLK